MKKSFFYILLGVTLLFSSCDSFFSTESPSAMDNAVYKSPDQIEQVIAGIYVVLADQNAYRSRLAGPWVLPGTDCEMYTTSAPDYAIYTMLASGNGDLVSKDKHPWYYLTSGIERASLCIEGIETYADTTKTDIRYLYGEALTLRAWLNYEMTKLWGDIPYLFHSMDGTDESIYPEKVDRDSVYEKMRIDLRHAAELMPNSASCPRNANNNVERCNREFALGLLARVDLVYAGKALRPDEIKRGASFKVQFNTTPEKRVKLLNEAIWACEEVIKADGDDKLMANYADVFKAVSGSVTEYNKTESLFEIPFADGVRGQFMNRMGAYVNKTAISTGNMKGMTTAAKSNAKIVATPKYIFSFDKADKRKWVTLSPGEWNYDTESKIDGVTGSVLYQKPEKVVKMYFGKYRHENMSFNAASDEDGINVPQMRYADVLLMYAEASIGSVSEVSPTYTGSISAQEVFDKVRARAGLGSAPLTMDNIKKERAWEFGGEFIRKYDLMRWGVFADSLWNAQEDIASFTHMNSEGKIDFTGTPYEGKLGTAAFFKYTPTTEVTQDGSVAYRISEIYGLALGENGEPDGYVSSTETGGWVRSDIFISNSAPAASIKENGNRIFGVDLTKDVLESRQYWPLFNVITSANPNLWNDYNY